jgi:Leucine-rich repeat (LRR) protein
MSEPEENNKTEEVTPASSAAEDEQNVPLPEVANAPRTTSNGHGAGSSSRTPVSAPAPGRVKSSTAAATGQNPIIPSSVAAKSPDVVGKPAAGEATSASVVGSGFASTASADSRPSVLAKPPTDARVTKLAKLPETATSNRVSGDEAVVVAAAQVSGMPSAKESEKNVPQDTVELVSNTAKEDDVLDESKPARAFEDLSDPSPPPTGLYPGQYFTQPGAIRVGLSQDIDQDDSESTLTYPVGPYSEEPSPSPQTGRQEVLVEASLVQEPHAINATTANVEESLQPMSTMTLVRAEAVPQPSYFRPRNLLIAVAILLVIVAGGVAGAVVATNGGGGSDDGDRALTLFPTTSPGAGLPTQSPSASPSTVPSSAPSAFELERFQEIFLPESQVALAEANSPQTLALNWLGTNADVATFSNEKRLQRFALATLYFATDGDMWSLGSVDNGSNGWLSDEDECDWYTKALGATFVCFGGKYQTINMKDNGLSGNLPAELILLTDLLSIQMGGNELSGALPTGLGVLTNLRSIQMDGNELSGSIPTSYGLLTDLRIVLLLDNFLFGPLPAELGDWRKLQSLDLSINFLTGQIPEAALLGWAGMQFLDLSLNELSGTIPSEIGNMSGLVGLGLYKNKLRGSIPSEFGLLTRLEILYLDGNTLTGTIPSTLGRLRRLEQLDIYSTEIFGTVPIELCDLVESNGLILSIDCELVECNCGCVCVEAEADFTFSPTVSVFPSIANNIPPAESPLDFELLPSDSPTKAPTRQVVRLTDPPTQTPAAAVTAAPVFRFPTRNPTKKPTSAPVSEATFQPTKAPVFTFPPNPRPTNAPIRPPTPAPTRNPLNQPTRAPTRAPTRRPTFSPTSGGNAIESLVPTLPFYSRNALSNPSSPQARAIEVLDQDPQLEDYPAFQVLQRYVLGVFYFSTGGERWDNDNGWVSASNECNWFSASDEVGDPCSQDGRYVSLSLVENGLEGEIPQELELLTALNIIDLDFNALSGTIPTLANLVNLQGLYLFDNFLSGEIPTSLGALTSLTTLDLDANALEGTLPTTLGSLRFLEIFLVSNNLLTGTVPSQYRFLTRLTSVAFEGNSLEGEISGAVLQGWSAMNDLNLGDNLLSGDIPSEIGALVNIDFLDLYFNSLSGVLPDELGDLRNAREIYLEDNFFSGTIPRSLGFLTNLEVLHLYDNDITGEVPPELCDLADNGLELAIDCFLIDCPCNTCNCDFSSQRR